MRNLNLFLAVFWLVLGVGLVLWHGLHPEKQQLRIPGTDWSPGWLGIVLAVYNLARWYSLRASLRQQEMVEEQWWRLRERERRSGQPPAEPDPNFDFSDPPPGAQERREGS